ncbi:MAG: YesL family protein [Clostridiales bacterium]|nr:YesL family protein [Clostridiales bacterium]
MSKFFDMDSPVMRFLTVMADLMILNILTIICCIPIFTVGASLTALNYVLLKMVRNEEGYIVKSFFKSFKQNFRQATIIWLIIFVFILVFVGDILIFNYSAMEFPKALRIFLLVMALFMMMVAIYVFPVLSRFDNTVMNTIKNSLFMSILSFPKTILMLIIYAAPLVLLYITPMAVPLSFMFGISAPTYFSAMLYSGTFKKFEPEEEPTGDRFETNSQEDDVN